MPSLRRLRLADAQREVLGLLGLVGGDHDDAAVRPLAAAAISLIAFLYLSDFIYELAHALGCDFADVSDPGVA